MIRGWSTIDERTKAVRTKYYNNGMGQLQKFGCKIHLLSLCGKDYLGHVVDHAMRDIPGFFWDEERSRYFKVAGPASAGASGFYTKASLSKRKQAALQESYNRLHKSQQKPLDKLVPRKTVRLRLERELNGSQHKEIDARTKSWAFHAIPTTYSTHSSSPIADFCMDFSSARAYVGASNTLSSWELSSKGVTGLKEYSPDVLSHTPIAPLASPVTSVSWDPSLNVLITTSRGNDSGHAELLITRESSCRQLAATSIIRNVPMTIFCSAVSSYNRRYAIGGSGGLRIYRIDSGLDDMYVAASGLQDVMATSFLDPNVMSCGCRDGSVALYDVRSKSSLIQTRFRHSAGITSIKSVNPYQMVVAGLQNTLALYDTRYLSRNPKKVGCASVVYQGHQNQWRSDLALGVGTNSVVASGDDKNLRIWNLSTADLVRTLSYRHTIRSIVITNLSLGQGFEERSPSVASENIWLSTGYELQQLGI